MEEGQFFDRIIDSFRKAKLWMSGAKMTDNLMSKIVHKFLSATSEFLGKIYGNEILSVLIFFWGLCFAFVNIIEFALFTAFLALGTVDAYTGCFSHRKVKFDRWSAGMTGFLVFALYFWWQIFFGKNHHNISLTNVPLWEWHNALCGFVYLVIQLLVVVLLSYIICFILKKVTAWLNRW